MTDKIVVLCTCDSAENAQHVARQILDARLAACVNLIPGVQSHYWWQGKIEHSEEWLLVIKTSRPLLDSLRARIEAVHSYQVPEVIALSIVDGSPGYLQWLGDSLGQPPEL